MSEVLAVLSPSPALSAVGVLEALVWLLDVWLVRAGEATRQQGM